MPLFRSPPWAAALQRLVSGDRANFEQHCRDVEDLPIRSTSEAIEGSGAAPVFIHLQKTGGVTLHHTLERYFLPWLCTANQLAGYDFLSSHFDVAALRLLGERAMRVMNIFREPRARLISFYRFHVGHALAGRYRRIISSAWPMR